MFDVTNFHFKRCRKCIVMKGQLRSTNTAVKTANRGHFSCSHQKWTQRMICFPALYHMCKPFKHFLFVPEAIFFRKRHKMMEEVRIGQCKYTPLTIVG